MKKILIAEDEVDLLELYSLHIEASLEMSVVAVTSGSAAVNELKKNGGRDIALIISDYFMAKGNGDIIYSYLRENNIEVPFLLVTGSPEVLEKAAAFKTFHQDDDRNVVLRKPCSAEDIIVAISQALRAPTSRNSDFTMLDARRLTRYNTIPVDIFLKINDSKFVKVLNKDELYNSEIISKYLSRGVTFFYLNTIDFKTFTDFHITELKRLMFLTNLAAGEKVDLQLEISAFVRNYVRMFGLDQKIVETVNQIAESTILLVKSNPVLSALLKKMLNSGPDYISEHSLLIAYVACEISKRLDWVSDTTYQKLGSAALLHDITLDSELAKVNSIAEISSAQSSSEIKEIKTHPYKIAEMVKELKNIAPDVDSIIFSHHERPDGSGFPRALTSMMISPLACIFILAEEFVNRTIQSEKAEINKAEEIIYFSSKFKHGNFKKPLEGLIGILSA